MSVIPEDTLHSLKTNGALNTHEAAMYIGISFATLKKWRVTGQGPRFARVGSRVVYLVEDLNTFLRGSRVSL